jgi:hypothetical protein
MTTRAQLIDLVGRAFSNQRELNNKLNPKWAEQGWHYYRAVWTEMAEAIGHTNWYWWKTGTFGKDMTPEQIREIHIELCDVLHFGISLDIIRWIDGGTAEPDLYLRYVQAFEDAAGSSESLENCLEGVVVDAILVREFNIKKFARACRAVDLDLVGLLTYYFGKSTLNQFRWDNGYNLPSGHPDKYVKLWKFQETSGAQEDNTILITVLQQLLADNPTEALAEAMVTEVFQSSLYKRLSHFYSKIER